MPWEAEITGKFKRSYRNLGSDTRKRVDEAILYLLSADGLQHSASKKLRVKKRMRKARKMDWLGATKGASPFTKEDEPDVHD